MGEITAIEKECKDRFGRFEEKMRILFLNEIVRVLSTRMQIESIAEVEKGYKIRPGKNVRIEPMAIINILEKDPLCRISGHNNEMLEVLFRKNDTQSEESRIMRLKDVLLELYHGSNSRQKAK